MPVIRPVAEPTVIIPVPSGLLHIPPGEGSLSTVPAVIHIVLSPAIKAGRAFTCISVFVLHPVGRV